VDHQSLFGIVSAFTADDYTVFRQHLTGFYRGQLGLGDAQGSPDERGDSDGDSGGVARGLRGREVVRPV